MKFLDLETISGHDYQTAHEGSEIAQLGKIVGYHHYYMISVFDAADNVQRACPSGWHAGYANGNNEIPPDKQIHRVGQIKVRSGDPEYVLYIENSDKKPFLYGDMKSKP
jgi:hypothetical protein